MQFFFVVGRVERVEKVEIMKLKKLLVFLHQIFLSATQLFDTAAWEGREHHHSIVCSRNGKHWAIRSKGVNCIAIATAIKNTMLVYWCLHMPCNAKASQFPCCAFQLLIVCVPAQFFSNLRKQCWQQRGFDISPKNVCLPADCVLSQLVREELLPAKMLQQWLLIWR